MGVVVRLVRNLPFVPQGRVGNPHQEVHPPRRRFRIPGYISFRSADEIPYKELSRDMTLVAITGIKDPLRPGLRDAVTNCHKAGVTIKDAHQRTTP